MDAVQVAARLLQYAAASAVGGAALYFVYGWRPRATPWPGRLTRWGAGLGVVSTAGWLVGKTAELADPLAAFSRVGVAVVLTVLATGLVNSWFLGGLPGMGGLLTTRYGLALTIKIGLFGAMLILAAQNRYRHTPRLKTARGDPGDAIAEA